MAIMRGMGFHLIFASIIFIATTHTCLGAQNMSFYNEHERLVLLKFKQSVSDEFGMLSSWVGKDYCQWKGVHCDAATRSVVGLYLRGQNIWNYYYSPTDVNYVYLLESSPTYEDPSDIYSVGQDCYLVGEGLNPSLAELRNLKYLDLSGNDFQKSRIPKFIGSLKHLSYLNLSSAGFSGFIPTQIGNLSKLEVLDLSAPNQDLMVEDLAWVFSLQLLKHLNLSGVDLRRAQTIKMVLYMNPSLVELSLSHCSLTNAHLGPYLNLSKTLSNIKYLDLSKNFLIDQLPPFLQNMTSLAFLDISNFASRLPLKVVSILNMIPSLSSLHLSDCSLHNEDLLPTNLNFSIRSNIQHLDLSLNSIEGKFPSVLKNISTLQVLDFHSNLLNSPIPTMPNLLKLDISGNNFKDINHVGIWRQCHLKQLSVSSNHLGEEIIDVPTNISECSRYGLEELYLDHNQLNGSIPESLIRLTNLRVLDLSSNMLIKLIPESLGRLRMLEVLDLSSNHLIGKIPVSIGQLCKISFLDVSRNKLEGMVFEAHFANLSMLTYFDISFNTKLTLNVSREWIPPFQLTTIQLSSCKITDEFPRWLRTQGNLKNLVLSNTSISGPLPTWFAQMPIIPHLDLSHNTLTGPLTNLPFGDHLNGFQDKYKGSLLLNDNLFSGSIPRSLCRRTSLEVLILSKNNLSGKIPKCLENLQNLYAMILDNNRMSGVIPSSIGRNSQLSWLSLYNNNFSGELPQDLANLHHLWVLDLGNNEFSGFVPEWISELTELIVLSLRNNKFTGRLYPSLCKNACLQSFDVAINNLKGSIPHCLEELYAMASINHCRHHLYPKERKGKIQTGSRSSFEEYYAYMDLSCNELSGNIPVELTGLTELYVLNLSHNSLTGNIPESIQNMKKMESLDFSVNKLTGMIPPSMVDLLYLAVLNLSHNNLVGQIPTEKQFATFDNSSYAGNEELCGPPLLKICLNPIPATTPTSKNEKKVWLYLDVMCGFATGLLGVIGALLFNKQWRIKFYSFAQLTMDNIYVAVTVKFNKMKRRPGEDI